MSICIFFFTSLFGHLGWAILADDSSFEADHFLVENEILYFSQEHAPETTFYVPGVKFRRLAPAQGSDQYDKFLLWGHLDKGDPRILEKLPEWRGRALRDARKKADFRCDLKKFPEKIQSSIVAVNALVDATDLDILRADSIVCLFALYVRKSTTGDFLSKAEKYFSENPYEVFQAIHEVEITQNQLATADLLNVIENWIDKDQSYSSEEAHFASAFSLRKLWPEENPQKLKELISPVSKGLFEQKEQGLVYSPKDSLDQHLWNKKVLQVKL